MADDSPESPPAPDGEAPSHVDLERLEGRHVGSGAARKHGLTVAVLEEWQDRFLLRAENALRARPKDGFPDRREGVVDFGDTLRRRLVQKLKASFGRKGQGDRSSWPSNEQ